MVASLAVEYMSTRHFVLNSRSCKSCASSELIRSEMSAREVSPIVVGIGPRYQDAIAIITCDILRCPFLLIFAPSTSAHKGTAVAD